MGPKKGKAKKKSKAELEAERVEAERQEALAAAEREKKVEEERRAAEERARVETERRRVVREEELRSLAGEAVEDTEYTAAKAHELARVRMKLGEEAAWQACLRCSKLPSAESDRELNTYLSELLDELEASTEPTLEVVLQKVCRTQTIAASLVARQAEARARRDDDEDARCGAFVSRLRDAVVTLVDRASAHVLQHADAPDVDAAAKERNEFIVTGADLVLDESSDADAGAAPTSSTGGATMGAETLARPGSSATILDHKASGAAPLAIARSALSSLNNAAKDNQIDKRLTIVRCELDEEADAAEIAPANRLEALTRGSLNFGSVNLNLDLPKSLGTQRLGARVVFFPYEHVPVQYLTTTRKKEGAEDEELQEGLLPSADMLVVGGVIQVELVDLPPCRHEIKPRLVMQQITDLATRVRVQHFPLGTELGAYVPIDKVAAPALNQYLRVRLGVPDGIVLPCDQDDDVLRVAWWDTARDGWIDGTTSQVEYNVTKREVGFNATRSGVLAVVQPRTLDLPYVSWALEASASDAPSEVETAQCRLTLVTPRFRLVVEVGAGGACRLVAPRDVPDLRDLLDYDLSPGRLVWALRRSGINVSPEETDSKASHSVKAASLELKLCSEVASLAAGFDFKNCPPELTMTPDRVAVHVRETDVFVGDNPAGAFDDSFTLLVERDVASKTKREAPDVPGDPPELKCGIVVGQQEITLPTDHSPACDESAVSTNQSEGRAAPTDRLDHTSEQSGKTAFSSEEKPTTKTVVPTDQRKETVDAKADESAEKRKTSDSAPPVAASSPTPGRTNGVEKRLVLNDSFLPGHTSHVSLRRCLETVSSQEAMDRVAQAPVVFQQSVTELLHLTRPFSFL
ncbi:hypothetical protein CTAYLR_007365 [Chrysophaeum taylorii]|uniref:IC97/Casc1 N-terminal domain-containing protein n=1 Tax=Chrysophaeum taylorii TaxID=2483200 RepID=A0AAD7U4G2_9STRA|nr:hypothetical protein CTAYLR_007365 [Chrysophaeum taylorii]